MKHTTTLMFVLTFSLSSLLVPIAAYAGNDETVCNKSFTNDPCVMPSVEAPVPSSKDSSKSDSSKSDSSSSDSPTLEVIVLGDGTQITAKAGTMIMVRQDPDTGKYMVGMIP